MRGCLRLHLRHRLASAILFGAFTLFAMLAMPWLQFDDGLESTFQGDFEASKRFDDYQSTYNTGGDTILVLVSHPVGFADPDTLLSLSDFVLELQLSEAFNGASSLFSLPLPPQTLDPAEPYRAVIDTWEDPPDSYHDPLNIVRAHPLLGHAAISADFSTTAIAVHMARSSEDLTAVTDAMTIVTEVAETTLSDDFDVAFTGLGPIRNSTQETIVTDTALVIGLGGFVATFAAWVFLQNVRFVVLSAIAGVVALIWTAGTLAVLRLPLTTLSTTLPAIVMVLSLANSLHLIGEYRRLLGDGLSREDAVFATWSFVGPACLMTGLTTCLAFATLTLTEAEIVQQLGFVGMIGTFYAFVSVMTVLSLLMSFFGPQKLRTKPYATRRLSQGVLHIAAALTARSKSVTGLTLALILCFATIAALSKPAFSFWEYSNRGSPPVRALDRANDDLLPVLSIDVPIIEPVAAMSLDALEDLDNRITALDGIQGALSLADLRRWLGEDPSVTLEKLGGPERSNLLSRDGEHAMIRAFTAAESAADVLDIVAEINTLRAQSPLATSPPTGLLALSAELSNPIISSIIWSLLIAVAASSVLLALWLRSFKLGAPALIPNVLPILALFSLTVATGNGITFVTVVVATIAYGIAIDDTVHVLNHWRRNEPWPLVERGRRALTEAGPAIIFTTFVVTTGLVSSLWGSAPSTISFGALMITVIVLALIADLFLFVPLLIQFAGHTERVERSA